MKDSKENIRNLSQIQLIEELEKIGEKKFRAKQVYEWLWKKGIRSFEEMHNVSNKVCQHLNERFFIDAISVGDMQKSADKTIKCAFDSYDQQVTEGVLIPTTSRVTACISSQV